MEIYLLNIDNKKIGQYKTYKEAEIQMNYEIKNNLNSTIEIILEDYCDNGNYDTCCKIYILCEYKNKIIKKYF